MTGPRQVLSLFAFDSFEQIEQFSLRGPSYVGIPTSPGIAGEGNRRALETKNTTIAVRRDDSGGICRHTDLAKLRLCASSSPPLTGT